MLSMKATETTSIVFSLTITPVLQLQSYKILDNVLQMIYWELSEVSEWLSFNTKMSHFSATLWREHVTFHEMMMMMMKSALY